MRINPEDLGRLSQDAQRQIAVKLALGVVDQAKRRKYGNTPTEINGIRFDSQKEAGRFLELTQLEAVGKITDLRLQPEYTLQEAFTTPKGEKVRAIRYRADFSYTRNGQAVIEDVKSEATRQNKAYQLKRKMMLEKGYTVSEI